jgi:hypothetical protein
MGSFDFIKGATKNELIKYIKHAQSSVRHYEKNNADALVDYYFTLGGEAYDEWVRRGYKLKAIEKYRWL